MIKKGYYAWILMYFLGIPIAQGQQLSGNEAQENLNEIANLPSYKSIFKKFDNRYEGVQGSPYFNDKWLNGKVVFENGATKDNLLLRYNAYEDQLIWNRPGAGPIILKKDAIASFALNIKDNSLVYTFVKRPHPKRKGQSQFYLLLSDGPIELLERTKIIFEKANFEGGYGPDKTYDEFKPYKFYYACTKDQSAPQKIKTTPAGVAKLFTNQREVVKKYIVDKQIDCKNSDGLVGIFTHFQGIN